MASNINVVSISQSIISIFKGENFNYGVLRWEFYLSIKNGETRLRKDILNQMKRLSWKDI